MPLAPTRQRLANRFTRFVPFVIFADHFLTSREDCVSWIDGYAPILGAMEKGLSANCNERMIRTWFIMDEHRANTLLPADRNMR